MRVLLLCLLAMTGLHCGLQPHLHNVGSARRRPAIVARRLAPHFHPKAMSLDQLLLLSP